MQLANAFFRDLPFQVQLFDYGARTDGQPEYMGHAPFGTGESDGGWVIFHFTYDASNFLTKTESVGEKTWALRAEYF